MGFAFISCLSNMKVAIWLKMYYAFWAKEFDFKGQGRVLNQVVADL